MDIQSFFENALTTVFSDVGQVHHSRGDNDWVFEITRPFPIKEAEMERVLKEMRKALKGKGYFDGGVVLRTLSGVHQAKGYDKEIVTRVCLFVGETQEDLDVFLKIQEDAQRRDHRKIGEEMDLWSFSPLVGAGLPLFTPRGTAVRMALTEQLVSIGKAYGMQPVSIPHIAKRNLYDMSGHSEKFGDELLRVVGHFEEFVMKPVNCPHHTQIYAAQPRSYRDLPLRYMETTAQYRDEQPGELMGMTRVRAITLDDGHIFCRIDQIEEEVKNIAHAIETFYSDLGLWGKHWVSLSVRDPNNLDGYIGENKDWEDAEKALQNVSDTLGLDSKRREGEAAIYGPKLDYQFKDSLGREWQLGTIQVDFSLPKRFALSYTNEKGKKETPVMIHRAILGSYERFLGLVLEHFEGWLPLWLAPVQVSILSVSEKHDVYAKEVFDDIVAKEVRGELSEGHGTLGKRIKKTKLHRTPFLVVVGDKEMLHATIELQNNKTGETVISGSVDEIGAHICSLSEYPKGY